MNVSQQIDDCIASYGDWRSQRLTELRKLINTTEPELTEDYKWNCPVWTYNGLVCAVSGFKGYVKINFFQGRQLQDKQKLFNSGLDSKEHRSINIGEKDVINKEAIADLVRQAKVINER